MNQKKLCILITSAMVTINLTACSIFKPKNNKVIINDSPKVVDSNSTSDLEKDNSNETTSIDNLMDNNTNVNADTSTSENNNNPPLINTNYSIRSNNNLATKNNTNKNNTNANSSGNSSITGNGVESSSSEDSNSTTNNNTGDTDKHNDIENTNEEQWKLVWSDEFNEKTLDTSKWSYDIGNCIVDANGNKVADGWGNNEKEYYSDSTNNVYDPVKTDYKTPIEPSVNAEQLPENSKIATSDGNYIYNGDFKDNNIQENPDGSKDFGTGWNFVHIPSAGGNGSISIDNINGTNYSKIDITSAVSKDYSIQLIQLTTLGKGSWYKLSYDAKTNNSRQINVKMNSGPARSWTSYTETYQANLTK